MVAILTGVTDISWWFWFAFPRLGVFIGKTHLGGCGETIQVKCMFPRPECPVSVGFSIVWVGRFTSFRQKENSAVTQSTSLRSLPKIIQLVNDRAVIGKFTAFKSCTPNRLTILSLRYLTKLYWTYTMYLVALYRGYSSEQNRWKNETRNPCPWSLYSRGRRQ